MICPNTCGIQSFITISLEPVFSYKKHYKLRYSQRTLRLEVSSSKLCMFLIYRRASFSVRCFRHPRGYKPYKANLCRRNDGSRAVTQRGERQTQVPFTVALVEEFCNCIREDSDYCYSIQSDTEHPHIAHQEHKLTQVRAGRIAHLMIIAT